jgi:transcriptional regulator NrdR family protein
MTCPICGGKTTVRDTQTDCEGSYRKRVCLECGHPFYTAEHESKEAFYRFCKLRGEYHEKWRKKRSEARRLRREAKNDNQQKKV